jgi:hypothetical protein
MFKVCLSTLSNPRSTAAREKVPERTKKGSDDPASQYLKHRLRPICSGKAFLKKIATVAAVLFLIRVNLKRFLLKKQTYIIMIEVQKFFVVELYNLKGPGGKLNKQGCKCASTGANESYERESEMK